MERQAILTQTPPVTDSFLNVCRFGAVPDGQTLSTEAIQRAIDTAAEHGGGTVVLPPGRFHCGALFLRSGVRLHLDAGATLLASESPDNFPVIDGRWEGAHRSVHACLINAHDAEHVTVDGRGTIDGRGQGWWQRHRARRLKHPRPRLIGLTRCRRVALDGFFATNSPAWTLNPIDCEDVLVRGVSILNPPDSPNTDGINPESCRNVRIHACHVDVGDDCITIKSGQEAAGREKLRPCENIVISDCTLVHGHGGVVIGSEMSGGVRNVVATNCVFQDTDRGVRIKTRRGRGGVVENIRINHLVMDRVLCPLVINMYYGCGAWDRDELFVPDALPVDDSTPVIRGVHVSHVHATDARYAAAYVHGLPESPVRDLALLDVEIRMDRHWTEAGDPAMAPGVTPACRAGASFTHVTDLCLDGFHVHDQVGDAVHREHVTMRQRTTHDGNTA